MLNAWIAGATGLVGGDLIPRLLADPEFARVTSVARRPLPLTDGKLVQVTVDFADARSFAALTAADVAFSCLGTTLKKAGSPEAFRAVDLDAVLTFAEAARAHGAKTFVHVSSLGANPRSSQLYLRTKGEIEDKVSALGFTSVYALRPSFLDGGDRKRPETRVAERIALSVARAIKPILGKYKPTTTAATARVMIEKAKERAAGNHIVEANEIV